ncbi:MAG: sel1 repeat family protein [Erysipelotrichaceae bacterium]|nr:sel1 repeat family protein [Erysipelotrichaceae bacterium]
MYEYGRGLEKDENKAFDLYKQAAAFNDDTGLFNLARCYEDGIGCDKNIINAIEYFQKSCDIGHVLSAFELGRIYHYKYGNSK